MKTKKFDRSLRISELIARLERELKESGDIPVHCYSDRTSIVGSVPVSGVSRRLSSFGSEPYLVILPGE